MDYSCKHLIIELYGCETDRATDEKYVEKIMRDSAVQTDATVTDSLFTKQGEGVMGAVFLTEGSYTVHTQPNGYVGLDLHTRENIDSEKALVFLVRKFGAEKYSASEIKRGER